MSLRKNFDTFTAQHKLRDAQEEFAQAVYRLTSAEETSNILSNISWRSI